MTSPSSQSIAIVGGGVIGMTLAWRLVQQGHRVTILEASDHLGGLADAWKVGGITWDRHYHVILYSDLALRSLLEDLGLGGELIWGLSRTGFYVDGQFHGMSSSWEFLKFPPLRASDKIRLAATILRASRIRDWRPLEEVTAESWLRMWSGDRVTDRIWLPLLRAKLGAASTTVSAAFIWATIARLYAARRSGLKQERFGFVAGGYARILEAFADQLRRQGVNVLTGRLVRRVESGLSGVNVVDEQGEQRFDRVVCTLPSTHAASICPQLSVEEKSLLSGIAYQGIVCASLVSSRPLRGYYVTNITDAGFPFTGVIETSALTGEQLFGGRHLVYLPKYAPPDDPIFEEDDDHLRQRFVSALVRMHKEISPADICDFRVSRVRRVFAIPTIGYSQKRPPFATSSPGVFILNSSQIVNGTLNVNQCIQLVDEFLDATSDALCKTQPQENRHDTPATEPIARP